MKAKTKQLILLILSLIWCYMLGKYTHWMIGVSVFFLFTVEMMLISVTLDLLATASVQVDINSRNVDVLKKFHTEQGIQNETLRNHKSAIEGMYAGAATVVPLKGNVH